EGGRAAGGRPGRSQERETCAGGARSAVPVCRRRRELLEEQRSARQPALPAAPTRSPPGGGAPRPSPPRSRRSPTGTPRARARAGAPATCSRTSSTPSRSSSPAWAWRRRAARSASTLRSSPSSTPPWTRGASTPTPQGCSARRSRCRSARMRRPGCWRAWADAAERPGRRTSAIALPVALVLVAARVLAGPRVDLVLPRGGLGGHLDLVRHDGQVELAVDLAAGHIDHGEGLRGGVDDERGAVGDVHHRAGLLPLRGLSPFPGHRDLVER